MVETPPLIIRLASFAGNVCPVSDDEGRISGWQGTFWDNSELAERAS